MMPYLLHVSLLLGACYLYYRLALRTETHFSLNRWLLLACIAASFTLPLITVPASMSLRADLEAEAELESESEILQLPKIQSPVPFGDRQLTRLGVEAEGSKSELESETLQPPASQSPVEAEGSTPINWRRLLIWVYLAGLLVFGLHFLVQVGALVVRMIRYPGHDLGDFRLVELDQEFAPYSFWNRIFLNPKHYDPDTFHRIVEHEQIHVNQRHSLDILLAELLIVVQWFNPFAWLYRAAIEDNLEYLTDAEMLAQGTDPTAYQLSLVQVAVPNHPQGLTSNYNQTFLEKRIKMMKAKKSSNRSGWKYFALLPLLLFSVLQLNAISQPVTSPQVIAAPGPQPAPQPEPAVTAPRPQPTPQPQPRVEKPVIAQSDITPQIDIDAITKAAIEEANASVDLKSITKTAVKNAKLESVTVEIPHTQLQIDYPEMAKAGQSWTATIEQQEVCFHFMARSEREKWNFTSQSCFKKADLGTLPGTTMGNFTIVREAGTMNMKGIFDGADGLGTFDFLPNPVFVNYLKQEGYGDYKEVQLMHFFFADFNKAYLKLIKKEGYEPSHDKLFEIAIFFDDQQEFEDLLYYLRNNGYDKPSLQRLIDLQIHGISPAYIEEINGAGFGKLGLEEIVAAKIHGVSRKYLAELSSIGFKDMSFDEAKSFAIHGVNPDFVRELEQLGFDNLSSDDILSARIHGMSSDFVKGIKNTGLPVNDFEELLPLKIHGVTPDFIAGIREQGFNDLKLEDFVSARIHGVTPSFIRSYSDLNLGKISFSDYVSLRIHGVSPSFIRKHRDNGDDVGDFVSMKIHGRY